MWLRALLWFVAIVGASEYNCSTGTVGLHPNATGLPDLVVDERVLLESLRFDTIRNDDPCLLVEGCLMAEHPNGEPFNDTLEDRRLLRFSTRVWNLGTADVHLGVAPMPEGAGPAPENASVDPWWEYSGCHDHYHLAGYAVHRLLNETTMEPIEEVGGSKTGFCARDNVCFGTARPSFTCDNQGISVNCSDHYGSELPCQWLDLTDIAPGRYVLEVVVNGECVLAESDYTNNRARVAFDTRDLSTFTDPRTAGTVTAILWLVATIVGLVVWWCLAAAN